MWFLLSSNDNYSAHKDSKNEIKEVIDSSPRVEKDGADCMPPIEEISFAPTESSSLPPTQEDEETIQTHELRESIEKFPSVWTPPPSPPKAKDYSAPPSPAASSLSSATTNTSAPIDVDSEVAELWKRRANIWKNPKLARAEVEREKRETKERLENAKYEELLKKERVIMEEEVERYAVAVEVIAAVVEDEPPVVKESAPAVEKPLEKKPAAPAVEKPVEKKPAAPAVEQPEEVVVETVKSEEQTVPVAEETVNAASDEPLATMDPSKATAKGTTENMDEAGFTVGGCIGPAAEEAVSLYKEIAAYTEQLTEQIFSPEASETVEEAKRVSSELYNSLPEAAETVAEAKRVSSNLYRSLHKQLSQRSLVA